MTQSKEISKEMAHQIALTIGCSKCGSHNITKQEMDSRTDLLCYCKCNYCGYDFKYVIYKIGENTGCGQSF